ncbi:MAG TPA: hypothetical protein VD884_00685 [Ohtaekwangia sp.]|nr:hypothetical protein [Ohtaekwangia sp.]
MLIIFSVFLLKLMIVSQEVTLQLLQIITFGKRYPMKQSCIFLVLMISMCMNACQQKANDSKASEPYQEESGNQALYDEVIRVHDEVMPKMSDMYVLKQKLTAKMDSVSAEKKAELKSTIQRLDSASNAMNVWMRQFDPKPDSAGVEEARQYLESEMKKINKVKAETLKAIDEARKKVQVHGS